MDIYSFAPSIATALFVGGVAWGATKSALNGTKTAVKEIKDELHSHISDETKADIVTHERIASVETKVDILLERLN